MSSQNNNLTYNESLIYFFLKKKFRNPVVLETKMKEYRSSGLSPQDYIKNRLLEDNVDDTEIPQKVIQITREHRSMLEVAKNKRKAGKVILWIMIAGAAGFILFQAYYYIISPAKAQPDDKLFCITPSGFWLHDQPGDTFERKQYMNFGDTAINQLDTTRDTWIAVRFKGKVYQAPKHYLKPYDVYKSIDSLYPNYNHDTIYEDIHSKIAMRTVDIIRNTLGSNLEEWYIPFNLLPKFNIFQEKSVLAVPQKIAAIDLPGEVRPFEKYHSVLLRKREANDSGIYTYQLLEFKLSPDAEVHLATKKEFKDRTDSCFIWIINKDKLDSGIVTNNVFLTNNTGRRIARLTINFTDLETKQKIVQWEWWY